MAVVEIDDDLRARFQAVAAPEEDLTAFVTEAMQERIRLREQHEAIRQHLRDEIQAVKEGRRRTAEEFHAEFRRRHNIPERPPMTLEQIAEESERVIAAMDPAVRSELEREGWL